jgi:hypothetical protein
MEVSNRFCNFVESGVFDGEGKSCSAHLLCRMLCNFGKCVVKDCSIACVRGCNLRLWFGVQLFLLLKSLHM